MPAARSRKFKFSLKWFILATTLFGSAIGWLYDYKYGVHLIEVGRYPIKSDRTYSVAILVRFDKPITFQEAVQKIERRNLRLATPQEICIFDAMYLGGLKGLFIIGADPSADPGVCYLDRWSGSSKKLQSGVSPVGLWDECDRFLVFNK